MGLRAAEALHKPFLTLDIGLPVHEVAPTLSRLLAGSAPDGTLKINSVNRRGRSMTVQVGATPLRTDERTVSGVILIIDPVEDSA